VLRPPTDVVRFALDLTVPPTSSRPNATYDGCDRCRRGAGSRVARRADSPRPV